MNTQVRKFLPLLLGLGLLLNTNMPTLAQSLEEQTVLADLALNIVRFTTWPTEAKMYGTIKFCVLGDKTTQQSFADIAHKAVGDKTLQLINLSHLGNFDQCHVLYISDLKQNILLQVLDGIINRPLLTIGEGFDFAVQGGMIGLENFNGKITLHVNLPVVRDSNLNISARLLKLTHILGKQKK
ncbi:MAG: YfiR family protein [Methylobacter sp.]|nr:YfiR family protein [Methylobacter sp.]